MVIKILNICPNVASEGGVALLSIAINSLCRVKNVKVSTLSEILHSFHPLKVRQSNP